MKAFLTTIAITCLFTLNCSAQWTASGSNIYNTNTGYVGIGTSSPTAALQIGNFSSGLSSSQIIIPGTYNFEQLRLGQIGNGNSALEFVNHNSVSNATGIKFLVDVDHGAAGLQIQYAPSATSYAGLSYSTGLYMNLAGNIGIGTTSAAYKLTVVNPAGQTPMSIKAGSGGVWAIGQNVGGGSNDDTFGIYSYTFGPTHGSFPLVQFNSSNGNIIFNRGGGYLGIGTATPDQLLTVNGTMHAKSVLVDLSVVPDYVFKPTYHLPTLDDVKNYIDKNSHLPEVPSEAEIKRNGLDVGEMNASLLKKVEELTLYLINEHQANKTLQMQVRELKSQMKQITSKLNHKKTKK